MKLIFDTSVWIAHLRTGVLDSVVPTLRGQFWLWIDSVAVGELLAGARTKREREVITHLVHPFEKAQRVLAPEPGDFRRAGVALGRLRARGHTLRNPGGALLDGLTASACARVGALLVTANMADFSALAEELPLHLESLDNFRLRGGSVQ